MADFLEAPAAATASLIAVALAATPGNRWRSSMAADNSLLTKGMVATPCHLLQVDGSWKRREVTGMSDQASAMAFDTRAGQPGARDRRYAKAQADAENAAWRVSRALVAVARAEEGGEDADPARWGALLKPRAGWWTCRPG